LRAALNLPPANRPALGKGPTGKDKPKSYDSGSFDAGSHSHLDSTSRESSDAASPSSTRTSSLSPSAINATMRNSPRSVQSIEGSSWDQSLLMGEQQPEVQVPTGPTGYQLPPVSAPMPQKAVQQYPYSSNVASSSRTSITNNMYMSPTQPNYPHNADRPMGNSYSSTGFLLRDAREEPQQQYSYSHSAFSANHDTNMHSHSPSHQPRETSPNGINFAHRRSLTEPQSFRNIVNHFPHLPNPLLTLPSPPRLQDSTLPPRQAATYGGGDGRLNSMS
jgi:hypothetical protein